MFAVLQLVKARAGSVRFVNTLFRLAGGIADVGY